MTGRVGTTITQHILNQQRENPQATGAFTHLLYELIVAAKVISKEVNKAGLADILGFDQFRHDAVFTGTEKSTLGAHQE